MFLSLLMALLVFPGCEAQTKAVTIAHLSDTHLGLQRAPHAADNLRRAVDLIRKRRPDAVIVTGDIAQSSAGRKQARDILTAAGVPVYFVPGNHDAHAWTMHDYRSAMGRDYYRVDIGAVTLLMLNSQLLGRWDDFEARSVAPMPPAGEAELEKMLNWLEEQAADLEGKGRTVIVVQHTPHFLAPGLVPDQRPYWTTQEPYRSRVLALLRRMGVREVLAGHLHAQAIFERDDITHRLAPATSWLPHGGKLGFAMHTIRNGRVETEFIYPEGMK